MTGADPISSQFSKIFSMISPGQKNQDISTGGGWGGGGGIVKEPITGDSLTQFLRSNFNMLGDVATSTLGQGQNTLGAGVNALAQPFDYWSAILSGDKNALAKAIGPTVGAVDKQFEAASRGASQNMARGGARDAQLAELPFQKAGKISDAILSLQPQAAQQLTGLASILTQLGLSQEQLAATFESILTSGQLTRRQQNNDENAATMKLIGDIATAAGSVAGGFAARSDRHLKRNVRFFGMENGHRVYRFTYLNDRRQPPSEYIGVMSDEVERIDPSAVIHTPAGILVNYDRIGVQFRVLKET